MTLSIFRFSSSHIFVLPSYREGLPQVALEAAASSMPLIITDTVGCRDCLEDKKSGFLIPIKDTVSLEEKIDFFIKNPEKVKTMGDRSKKFVENNFSEEIIFNQFLSLLKGT